eukprot:ANDGO_07727.mRNA.1 hypothetical protein
MLVRLVLVWFLILAGSVGRAAQLCASGVTRLYPASMAQTAWNYYNMQSCGTTNAFAQPRGIVYIMTYNSAADQMNMVRIVSSSSSTYSGSEDAVVSFSASYLPATRYTLNCDDNGECYNIGNFGFLTDYDWPSGCTDGFTLDRLQHSTQAVSYSMTVQSTLLVSVTKIVLRTFPTFSVGTSDYFEFTPANFPNGVTFTFTRNAGTTTPSVSRYAAYFTAPTVSAPTVVISSLGISGTSTVVVGVVGSSESFGQFSAMDWAVVLTPAGGGASVSVSNVNLASASAAITVNSVPPGTYSGAVSATDCAGQTTTVTVTVYMCGVGYWFDSSAAVGTNPCKACLAGTKSNTLGITTASSCAQCGAGTWSGSGASSCIQCGAGTYSSAMGANSSTTCIQCGAGTYSSVMGANSSTTCIQCGAGTYSSAMGANSSTTCIQCGAGTYSSAMGANSSTTCIQCGAGTYSSAMGANSSTTCIQCGAGTYSSALGAQSAATCLQCAAVCSWIILRNQWCIVSSVLHSMLGRNRKCDGGS